MINTTAPKHEGQMEEFQIQIAQHEQLNAEIQSVLDSFSEKISPPNLENSDDDNLFRLPSSPDSKEFFYSQLIAIIVEYFNQLSELPPPSILLEHYVENLSIPELEQILLDEMNPRLIKWGLPLYELRKIKTVNLKNNSKYDPL